MKRLGIWIDTLGGKFNYVACAAVVIMMVLTCSDVILRLFGHPILGTYEMIGFSGSVVISFALAYTSLERGHIAVELLVDRLPQRLQFFMNSVNSIIGVALFGIITWQSFVYAADLRKSGEVSLTLQFPTYPFVYGISAGCCLLCLVLLVDAIRSIGKLMDK
jgi:TRAP-type C4-dicarboxylate transport system permease small subunit